MRWLYSLTDQIDDRWFGEDKVSHWLGAAFAMCKARELLALSPGGVFWSWVAVVFLILLVEIIELERWQRWQAKGAPAPWPWLCDRVSLKDIAWGLLGAWMATL